MSIEENKAIVRRWHDEVWTGWNLEVVDELLHSDYVQHPSQRGLSEAKQALAQMASQYPDSQLVTEDTIAEGDKVVTRWTALIGGNAQMTGVSIHRIADGKIVEDWAWTQSVAED
jgi:predicted SnoaL-like aldol condensation-catalyzing enzyme